MDLQIEGQCRIWRNWSRESVGVWSQASEFLKEKSRERISDDVSFTGDVGCAKYVLVGDGVPGETTQEWHDGRRVGATFVDDIDYCKVIRVYEDGFARPFMSPEDCCNYYGIDFEECRGSYLALICKF